MAAEWVRRVLVVEDQGALRALVHDLFARSGFAVESRATAVDALAAFAEFDPDALVADIDLGSRPDGIELATALRRIAPHLGVVFLTNYPRRAAGTEAFGLPGAVFVGKAELDSPEQILAALERALRPSGPADPTDAAAVSGSEDPSAPMAAGGRTDGGVTALTRHQLAVLGMVAQGWSNEQIAQHSGATVRAVERSISRIFDRLGVSGDPATNPRVAAAARYLAEFGPQR
ncbi:MULTISPECIES: response regulator transcription factor [unclassified Leucobacter]|uniref:response regulator transcription factor n=1 Tax=unclassified Leucobacter TaxID=2621730 RepID=UPI0006217CF5|nr:response regulator transcription factor [Leucobacter sp. Ag1]KKI16850.1 response regulator receiver protein [Leucobacter sp. Ag1]